MVVVGVCRVVIAADRADAALAFEQEVTILDANSIRPPQMICAAFRLSTGFTPAHQTVALRTVLVPILERLHLPAAVAPLVPVDRLWFIAELFPLLDLAPTVTGFGSGGGARLAVELQSVWTGFISVEIPPWLSDTAVGTALHLPGPRLLE
jgi:hypothetical protein